MRIAWLCLVLLLAACTWAPPAVPDGLPSSSSPVALSQDGSWLWVVNPDHDSVTRVPTDSLDPGVPVPVGREPWAVAVAPDGSAVVLNRRDGSLSLVRGTQVTTFPVGSEPGGLALSPSGRSAYLTLSSGDEVIRVDLGSGTIAARLQVGPHPWAIAVTDDGDLEDDDESVVVAHRFARLREGGVEASNTGKEGWLTILGADLANPGVEVAVAPFDFGYANVLEGLALHQGSIWLAHQLNAPELPRTFDTTVSAALTPITLDTANVRLGERIHLNDSDFSTPVNFPRAVALSPDGLRAYVVLAGSDAVMGIDLSEPTEPTLVGFWPFGTVPGGSSPRGLVISRDGTRGYLMNYLSRDVSVLDLADEQARRELSRVSVAPETLSQALLRGKVMFNNASDPRLSHLGWINCSSCHPDGGSDTTTWVTPEGVRQTMPLWRLEGTAPFHISASRDEIQDFENDIEELMDGFGLAPGVVQRLLGVPNGGRSDDLDALAAFLLTGVRTPVAAVGDPAMLARGRELFIAANCGSCHGGPAWAVSSLPGPVGSLAPNGELEVEAVLVDVGTYAPGSDILGAQGFDISTLLGLHASAPYLHNGSAATLVQVLTEPAHSGTAFTPAETADLAAFLASIDDSTVPVSP